MNKPIFFSVVFTLTAISMLAYNAYYHNWQLLFLWFAYISQSVALGGVLSQIKNND